MIKIISNCPVRFADLHDFVHGETLASKRAEWDRDRLKDAIKEFNIDPTKFRAVEIRDCGRIMFEYDDGGHEWVYRTEFIIERIGMFSLNKGQSLLKEVA